MKIKFSKTFKRQAFVLLPVFLSGFAVQCSRNWLPNVVYYVTQPYHRPYVDVLQSRDAASLSEFGKLCTVVPAGYLAGKFGRKNVLIMVTALNFLSWVMLSAGSSVILIYIGRILAGIAEGLGVTSQILISEIASPQYRGTFFSLGNIVNNCGSLFESFLNAIFASYAVLTYAPTVLSFCLLPSVWWFVESPYYLVYAGRYDRAKASLAVVRVEHTVAQIDQEFETIKSSINEEKKKTEIGWTQLFSTSSIRRSLLGLLLMSVFMPACGYTSLRLYMTISVPENAYFSNSVYPLICGASEFVASMWAVALMDRLPRRFLFTVLCTLNALLHCFSGAMCYLYFQHGVDACKWGIIGGTFAYMTLSSMLAPLNDSIRMEILPYSIKGIGMALCMIIRSMMIVLCYKLYTLFEIHYGLYANYAFFAANSMCVVAVVRCMLPETGGKSLIEVQKALAHDEKSPA